MKKKKKKDREDGGVVGDAVRVDFFLSFFADFLLGGRTEETLSRLAMHRCLRRLCLDVSARSRELFLQEVQKRKKKSAKEGRKTTEEGDRCLSLSLPLSRRFHGEKHVSHRALKKANKASSVLPVQIVSFFRVSITCMDTSVDS